MFCTKNTQEIFAVVLSCPPMFPFPLYPITTPRHFPLLISVLSALINVSTPAARLFKATLPHSNSKLTLPFTLLLLMNSSLTLPPPSAPAQSRAKNLTHCRSHSVYLLIIFSSLSRCLSTSPRLCKSLRPHREWSVQ